MSERARSVLLTLLLAAALVAAVVVTVRGIEGELLARSQLALAAAGIPFYDIDVSGRDAVLSGFVTSTDQARRIVDVVAAVPGVRAVHSNLVVEHIVEPSRPLTPAQQPTLRVQRSRSMVRVSGRLGSAAESTALIQALEEAFPRDEIVQALQEGPGIGRAPWLDDPGALAAVMAAASGDVRLLIQGETAVLSGEVRDAEARERVLAAGNAISGLVWRFELFSTDGSVSGAGGGA